FLPEEALFSWGWRIPFWLSALVVLTAWLIRRGLDEPPAFKEARNQNPPLLAVFRWHKAAVLRVASCAMVNTVNMVFTVWSLSFATSIVGLERSTMLLVSVIANGVALFAIPLAAILSDRIGRKPVFITGALGAGLMMFPYLAAVSSGNWTLIFICGAIMSGCAYSMSNSIWPSFYAEMFPTTVRVTGLALGTQIGFAVSGGLAPVLASAVAGASGENWISVAGFTAGVCVFTALAAMTAKETKSLSLEEIDTVHAARSH
ncbi:MAG: MFS transporter, partial [Brevibacterium aurantiacum]